MLTEVNMGWDGFWWTRMAVGTLEGGCSGVMAAVEFCVRCTKGAGKREKKGRGDLSK